MSSLTYCTIGSCPTSLKHFVPVECEDVLLLEIVFRKGNIFRWQREGKMYKKNCQNYQSRRLCCVIKLLLTFRGNEKFQYFFDIFTKFIYFLFGCYKLWCWNFLCIVWLVIIVDGISCDFVIWYITQEMFVSAVR